MTIVSELEVGASIETTPKNLNSFRVTLFKYGKKAGKKFTTKVNGAGNLVVTRVA